MPTFSSKPIGGGPSSSGLANSISKLAPRVRRHPVLLFGVPFLLTIVGGSYGLSYLTQTRYDYNATKVQTMSKQDELGMRKDRRRLDIREEYFRLQASGSDTEDWEPKRIQRPPGVPEWGVPPTDSKNNATQLEELSPGQSDPVKSVSRNKSGKPSVILGPDGKPCRACNSKLAFSAAMRSSGSSSSSQQGQQMLGSGTDDATGTSGRGSREALQMAFSSEPKGGANQCPPDGEDIGHSTWTFLHSAAAYYPLQPSPIQQKSMAALIEALPSLYPCHSCADALQEELQRESRENKSWQGGKILREAVKSGPGLRKWLCGLHNEVNERLGKPTWRCEEEDLQTRWLTGPQDGSCD